MSKLQELLDKLGATLEYEDIPEENLKIAKLRSKTDLKKGSDAMFEVSNKLYKDLPTIDPKGTYLPKDWQGQGLATELYKELERITGAKIVPGDDQSQMSYNLHDKKGFGKEFGIKESTLNKLLAPQEKVERELRKASLQKGLESLVSELEDMGRKGIMPGGVPLEEFRSEIDTNILGNVEPRNAPSLLDNIIMEARNRMKGPEAAEFVRKRIPSTLSKVKSFAPILAGGAGLALSAAAEASDAPEAGDVLGQEALERDIAASKQEKQIEGADVPKEVKMKALELFKKNRLPY